MAVSVSPIKIISDLGYDPVDIETDKDYLSALMEATNMLSIEALSNPGRNDARIKILQDEVRRIRADRKKEDPKFKERKTKINIGSFLGRDTEEPQKLLEPAKDDKDDKEQKKRAASGGLVDTINAIAETVARIETTLISQKKLDEDKQKNDKQLLENLKRDNEESRLGKVTGFLKKAGDKIIQPVQSIFGQIFGFIKKLILGKIFLNILKWFGNPENQGKIDSVIKFFGNNWKKLLSLYLVFGTGLGKFVRFITKVAIKGVAKLIILGAKILAAKKVKGARGFARMLGGKKGKIITGGLTALTSVGMYAGVNNMLSGGEEEEPQKLNKGGKVRGQGDKDTVPAMLTPGEFVMSKGAVQQYGIDTMEAMNAAAGGTNVPVLMPNKKRKGFRDGGDPNAPTAEDFGLPSDFDYDDPKHRELLVDVLTPHMKEFVKVQNKAVDENPDAYKGIKLTLDRDGRMPNFGEFIANMSEEAFNNSVAMVQSNESMQNIPEAQGAILNFMTGLRSQTLDDPNFKENIAFDINKDIPGTAAYRILMAEKEKKGQSRVPQWYDLEDESYSQSFSATEIAALKNKNERKNFNGGGFVQGLSGGGSPITGGDALSGKVKFTKAEIEALNQQYNPEINDQIRDLQTRVNDLSRSAVGGWKSKKDYNEYRKLNRQLNFLEQQKRMGRTSAVNLNEIPVNQKKKSGGGFGLKRMIGGAADQLTGNLFDFDKRSGGGLIRKTANAVGKTASGIGKGLSRAAGGTADMLTGNLFDFDNKSGGGLIRKTANALGSLFGGSKPNADKVMAKEPKIKEIKIPAEGLDSLLIKIASKQDIKTPVGQPSLSGPKITVLPENKSINVPTGEGAPDSGKAIPKFDVGYGSVRKMKQLGISR